MGFLPTFIYYVATIFIVILAYFHMECINEKEEEAKTPRFDKFNSEPGKMDKLLCADFFTSVTGKS